MVVFLEQQFQWQQNSPRHNTTSTMLNNRYGVLKVKSLTFSPPNILLLILAKQLNGVGVFLQNVFSLSMCSAANFSRALRWSGSRASSAAHPTNECSLQMWHQLKGKQTGFSNGIRCIAKKHS